MDLETEAAQRVGTTLCNKWTLERLIGTGGMAAVYVAIHKIGRREAIKILHSDVARDPELRARFEQEANAVNSFKHQGAVEVRDIDVAEDGSPFLVMELLDGQPLAELARRPGGVEPRELLRLVDEMLDVLAAAHARGIIHRDIKPDNLFVLQDGRLKVLDFGIARVRADAPPKLRTRAGATLGTAPYMPPEQIRGTEIDARADLFAVGATMFRLIAKRRIHEAESETETLIKMASLPAPPLASVAPDVPRDVCLVVDRALKFDREQRYPDAVTMQSDVRALREGRPPPYAAAHAAEEAPSTAQPVTLPATAIAGAHPPETPKPPAQPAISSGASTAEALTRGARAALEKEATSHAEPQAAPADGRTMAASPGALHGDEAGSGAPTAGRLPVASDPVTLHAGVAAVPSSLDTMTPPPASMRVPLLDFGGTQSPPAPPSGQGSQPRLDPATRPAMMVLGAAGTGAPLTSTPAGAAAVDPALAQGAAPGPSPEAAAPQGSAPAPERSRAGERTLRSVLGPEAAGSVVAPQGYSVATTVLPQVQEARSVAGPRTQLSGMAVIAPPVPSAPLAPGESIPVLPAPPPPPRRRRTLPGTEISVWPLVAVGVLFATIGVAVTLWLMLRAPDPGDMSTYPMPTANEPSINGPRSTARPASHGPLFGPTPPPPTRGPVRHPR